MPPAPLPLNEKQRLEVLKCYDLQRVAADDALAALARCASNTLGTAISLVSVVESERQWFPAKVGLPDKDETPREHAFCSYTILDDALLEVEDAAHDPRFRDNPLVTDTPWIRFYAGVPLASEEGCNLGALCVIDHSPRRLRAHERNVLHELAGAVRGVLSHYRKQAQLLRIVEQARQSAEEASQAKSMFLAGMSHELRTPLNAVLGFSDLIAREAYGPLPDPRYREAARYIDQSGRHLLELINELMDLSRVEAGQSRLAADPLDLSEVLDWAVTTVEEQALAKGITVESALARGEIRIRGDRRACRQIVLNIISNAVKYTLRHGHVRIEARRAESGFCGLSVRDSGVGIPETEIRRLFEPFERMDQSLVRNTEGAGLGLSLAKRLIEAHGGRIQVDSTPGVGTTVHLDWPCADGQAPQACNDS